MKRKDGGVAAIVAAVAGNALEWFDFTVYGLFAPEIGRAFFPAADPFASLLAALASFGAGFVLRPAGAIILGQYADRAGRRAALTLIVALMTLGTLVIALTPPAASIGPLAPLLALVARLVQGFSVGGELGGATAFLIETAPSGRRGLYASWQFAGQAAAALAGSLLGAALHEILSADAVARWGWRIPFLIGLAIAPVGLYLRARMPETLDRATCPGPWPLSVLLRRHRRAVAKSFGVTVLGTAATYLTIFYMPTYAVGMLGMTRAEAFAAAAVASALFMVATPMSGRLSDRIGRGRLMPMVASAILVAALPLYALLVHWPGFPVLLAVQGTLALLLGLYVGPSAAFIGEMFPAEVRSTGMSLGYNLAVPPFGGFAPFVVAWLDDGSHLSPAWYMTACAAATLALLRIGD